MDSDPKDTRWLDALNSRLDRQDEAADESRRDLSSIKVTLAQQHTSLEDHMRRSLANEEALELLRAEIKPISVHVAVVGALGKVVAGIGSIVGIALGIQHLLGH